MSAALPTAVQDWLVALQWGFLCYFVLLNGGYLILNLLSLVSLRRYLDRYSLDMLPRASTGFDPPISLLVPAYNEEATITASLRSLLQLDYPEFEIVVINDGSKDGTLAELFREFDLLPFPEAYRRSVPCREVRGIFRSTRFPSLRVIDKENGGKADALNAGINAARFPLFCAVDADSILQRDSLTKVVRPFVEDPRTIVAGGTVRIANGCRISAGFLTEVGLPDRMLVRFQVIEYLRAFLFGRLGWTPLNAVLIISGAFGLFRKAEVVAAGGYRHDTVGEDMELIVRLHRINRERGTPYRITYVPDPICWTEAPESLKVLRAQRTRWQRGLAESLAMNRSLLFHRRGGAAGWLAFPFFLLFEFFGPVLEIAGYALIVIGTALGIFSWTAFEAFMFVALSFGLLLSVTALLLEEMSFRLYPKKSQLLALAFASVVENFGYRQLVAFWRLQGLWRWAIGSTQHWGEMTRGNALGKDKD
ncbi:MAG: glycosyltransferase family 2 protein [Sulfuritalea sp.]|nr:glycosyltransferase family 2 protein [Sulfuritalea sp.]